MQKWQAILTSFTITISKLLAEKGLTLADVPFVSTNTSKHFPLKLTKRFFNKIKSGDAFDPLLLQILPSAAENSAADGFFKDPLQEKSANVAKGIIHKFHQRILVTLTGACAINCRYCFRQYYSYSSNIAAKAIDTIYEYINKHNIYELILSGGDPLLLTDAALEKFFTKIKTSSVKIVRIHTRLLNVLPERFTKTLIDLLKSLPIQVVIVTHINHSNELDEDIKQVAKELGSHNITVLNQSVLLHGVNTNAATLVNLSLDLFAHHIMPYYLHILDPVQGSQRFYLPKEKAIALHHEIKNALPGYLVPKLVQEQPKAKAKVWIN